MELNEDKILDFLDGSLTSTEEEELLHRLAVSPERRVVLKQHLQLRELSAILAKKHNYIVPKVLTAQLFTNLSANGYEGPMYHAATDTDTLKQSLEANLDRSAQSVVQQGGIRRSSLIFSSVLSFIAGAFLVYLLISSPSQLATGSSNVSMLQPTADAVTAPETTSAAPVSHVASGQTEKPVSVVVDRAEAQPFAASEGLRSESAQAIHTATDFGSVNGTVDLGVAPEASMNAAPVAVSETSAREGLQFASSVANEKVVRNERATKVKQELLAGVIDDAAGKNWWQGEGMYSTLDNLRREKGYFGLDIVEDSVPFIRRTMASLRSGGGKAPGRTEDYTGSLVEFKLSADFGDWLVAKASFGQFMPYETEALSVGKNADGIRMLKLVPVLQYHFVVGAELGFHANVLGTTLEMTGGFLSDLRNGFIPRASIFTTLMLQDNLSLQMGVEGALYTHDIRPSLENKQTIFALENPVLTNAMQETETAGFIGPALELAWHF